MSNLQDIHPDFQSIKARPLTLKRPGLALMNGLLGAVNALACRRYKPIISTEKISGAGDHRVPLLIIRPENLPSPAPALVYCHGGAFILKHAPPHIANAVRYAREASCCVVFVDYRLAPGHPFPAGFDDCYTALRWALANAEKLGIDKDRVAVGGDSAGGAMAAAVAQKAVHEDGITLRGQLLIYPTADWDGSRPSFITFANVPPFKDASKERLWQAYVGHPLADGIPRYAAPLRGELSGVAPAYVETAEFDPLRDEGNAYAQALIASGVDVEAIETKGAVHGYDLLVADSVVSKGAMESRIGFLRRIFLPTRQDQPAD